LRLKNKGQILDFLPLIFTMMKLKPKQKNLFSDCLALQQGLQDALTLSDPTIQVKFTDEGKLLYSWETQHGSKKRCFEFGIPLKEVQLDPFKILERKNEKLQKRVEEQEVIITQLKNQNVNKEVLDKIEDLEKKVLLEERFEVNMQGKIQKLERLITDMLINLGRRCDIYGIRNSTDKKTKEIYQFNTESKNAKAFDFSNNNQSVTLNLNLNEEAYRAISSDRPLPKTRTSFSVKIDDSKSNRILIGIIPANSLQSGSCHSSSGTYFYYTNSGRFYINGNSSPNFKLPPSSAGSTITVTVDLSASKIKWTLDDGHSFSTTINGPYINQYDYFPCIELIHKDDKVSFI